MNADRDDIEVKVPKGWKAEGRTRFTGELERDLVLDVRLTQSRRAWLFETLVQRPLQLLVRLL